MRRKHRFRLPEYPIVKMVETTDDILYIVYEAALWHQHDAVKQQLSQTYARVRRAPVDRTVSSTTAATTTTYTTIKPIANASKSEVASQTAATGSNAHQTQSPDPEPADWKERSRPKLMLPEEDLEEFHKTWRMEGERQRHKRTTYKLKRNIPNLRSKTKKYQEGHIKARGEPPPLTQAGNCSTVFVLFDGQVNRAFLDEMFPLIEEAGIRVRSIFNGTMNAIYGTFEDGQLDDEVISAVLELPHVTNIHCPGAVNIDSFDTYYVTNQMTGPYRSDSQFWGLDAIDQRSPELDGRYSYQSTGSQVVIYIVDTYKPIKNLSVRWEEIFNGYMTSTNRTSYTRGYDRVAMVRRSGVAKEARVFGCRFTHSDEPEPDDDEERLAECFTRIGSHHTDLEKRYGKRVPAVLNLSLKVVASAPSCTDFNGYSAYQALKPLYDKGGGTKAFLMQIVAPNSCILPKKWVITVGSFSNVSAAGYSAWEASPWSSGGCAITLLAPGDKIRAAGHTSNDAFDTWVGTSFAAPHVTGAVARLLAVDRLQDPANIMASLRAMAYRGVLDADSLNVNPMGDVVKGSRTNVVLNYRPSDKYFVRGSFAIDQDWHPPTPRPDFCKPDSEYPEQCGVKMRNDDAGYRYPFEACDLLPACLGFTCRKPLVNDVFGVGGDRWCYLRFATYNGSEITYGPSSEYDAFFKRSVRLNNMENAAGGWSVELELPPGTDSVLLSLLQLQKRLDSFNNRRDSFNDQVTSILVPAFTAVTLYADDWAKGLSYTVYGPKWIKNLQKDTMGQFPNNALSSVELRYWPFPGASGYDDTIVLKSDCFNEWTSSSWIVRLPGLSTSDQKGYLFKDLEPLGFKDNTLSEVSVPPGYKVFVYEHDNYQGLNYPVYSGGAF
ncbi:hypothetical protein HK104_007949, partial [Borealophlyctis nickersoniae]